MDKKSSEFDDVPLFPLDHKPRRKGQRLKVHHSKWCCCIFSAVFAFISLLFVFYVMIYEPSQRADTDSLYEVSTDRPWYGVYVNIIQQVFVIDKNNNNNNNSRKNGTATNVTRADKSCTVLTAKKVDCMRGVSSDQQKCLARGESMFYFFCIYHFFNYLFAC